ncbi:ATP-dependent nuclease [Cytobacillus kochii]|uniref:ATP-dependent nuclease n=1 Tax=Cytobacillus kochii TaxID=859143 RepID=UPI0024816D02|nr:AAA family ATPase [Cytobacillus kochii]
MRLHSAYINGYKCFEEGHFVGMEEFMPLNIIIGRNNVGKSSMIDILSLVLDPEEFKKNKENFSSLIIGYKLDFEVIESTSMVLKENAISYIYPNIDEANYLGKVFHVKVIYNEKTQRVGGQFTEFKNEDFHESYEFFWEELASQVISRIREYTILRLGAERNIVPEKQERHTTLLTNGEGATNVILQFITMSSLDGKLVEETLLGYLNEILHPDLFFTDIVVQQVNNNDDIDFVWEIFLEEEGKGRIPISKSGSGLKTIILVLVHLILIPILKDKNPSKIIYAMEELENNLHPFLQRSLFSFIHKWSVENESVAFLTTHSHIPINMFSREKNVNIIHLRKIGDSLISKVTMNYHDSADILEDLDIKASDLLQSNGIIWVEGPTDRMYLNKWIELFSDGKLKEGIQYQIVYYGGRLLSHYSAVELSEENALINVLLTNRNSVIIMDSDKRTIDAKINDTKVRINNEFSGPGSFSWITAGKEIENYIPPAAILKYYKTIKLEKFTAFMNVATFLDSIHKGEGNKYLNNKVEFARSIIPYLSKKDLEKTLDLREQINKLIKLIQNWNK